MAQGNSRKNPVTDEQVVAAYHEANSIYKVSDTLGISTSTIYRILESHGIERVGLAIYRENATKFAADKAKEIWAKYQSGLSLTELVSEYGGTHYSIKAAIRRAGGTVKKICPRLTPEELSEIRELQAAGKSQMEISIQLGRSQSFISRALRQNGHKPTTKIGADHPMWNGGRYKDGSGYIRAWVPDGDELSCMRLADRTVLEHRLVMARHLGRPLLTSETVHHINGDRTDNRIENLELRQGKHGKHIVMCCLECGSRNVAPVGLSAT